MYNVPMPSTPGTAPDGVSPLPDRGTPDAGPGHPEWCVREACDIRYDPLWTETGDGWVGTHSTRPVSLDFDEHGGVDICIQQFREGGAPEAPRLALLAADFFRLDAEQAVELARVVNEHAALLIRITGA